MKQKQRMLGILAALVLLLALGVVLATRYTAQKTAGDEAASSEETVTISSFSASDLRTLTWIYQEQSATLNRDEDGNWTPEGSEAAVQATRADSMVTALCSLTSNRVITGADPAQYGMTDPVVTVMYTLADGTENTPVFRRHQPGDRGRLPDGNGGQRRVHRERLEMQRVPVHCCRAGRHGTERGSQRLGFAVSSKNQKKRAHAEEKTSARAFSYVLVLWADFLKLV